MRGGDIDNVPAPGLGIRFERVIKTEEGKLNKAAKAYLLDVTRSIDVNVYIITTKDPRKAAAFCMKWGVPYHKIIPADVDLEIPDIVREMDLLTYYDLEQRVIQNVNSRGFGKVRAELWTHVSV